MNNTKVFGIKEIDFFTFIKKINEFYSKNKVFATQTYIDDTHTHFAVIYFESQSGLVTDSQGKTIIKSDLPPFSNSGKVQEAKQTFPSPDIKLVTDKQKKQLEKNKDYLEEKGIAISAIKTSKEAWDTLNKLYTGEL